MFEFQRAVTFLDSFNLDQNLARIQVHFKLRSKPQFIAKGGYGAVFKSTDNWKQAVAIKVIGSEFDGPNYRRHWAKLAMREAKLHRMLKHTNIVDIFDTMWLDSLITRKRFLAIKMEFLNMDLCKLLKTVRN